MSSCRESLRIWVVKTASLFLAALSASSHAASSLDTQSWDAMRRPPHPTSVINVEPSSGSAKGTPGNDAITGSDSRNQLFGLAGDDGLDGGGGDDELDAGEGNDWLSGGPGNDLLRGGTGNDRYEFRPGSGADRIDDPVGLNTVMIIDASRRKMGISRRGEDYVISYGAGDTIQISKATFETLQFLSLRTLMNRAEFLQMYGASDIGSPRASESAVGKRTLKAGPLGGQVSGTPADETLLGGAGEDILIGAGGNDEFRPGKPSGALAVGGTGDDLYVFALDDGRMIIRDEGGRDAIRMGAGIKPPDVSIRVVGLALNVLVNGSSQSSPQTAEVDRWSIQIMNMQGAKRAGEIEAILFDDGSEWRSDEIRRRASGK